MSSYPAEQLLKVTGPLLTGDRHLAQSLDGGARQIDLSDPDQLADDRRLGSQGIGELQLDQGSVPCLIGLPILCLEQCLGPEDPRQGALLGKVGQGYRDAGAVVIVETARGTMRSLRENRQPWAITSCRSRLSSSACSSGWSSSR